MVWYCMGCKMGMGISKVTKLAVNVKKGKKGKKKRVKWVGIVSNYRDLEIHEAEARLGRSAP